MTDHEPTGDPFPREPFGAFIRRMPRYGKLAIALGRDPAVSRARRAVVLAGAAYLISPVDLVPGLIPVLGQLDDLLVVLLAMRVALAGETQAGTIAASVSVAGSFAELLQRLQQSAASELAAPAALNAAGASSPG